MRTASPTKTTCRSALDKFLVISLSLACSAAAGAASAQVIVHDPILLGEQSASNATQGTQLAKQILQYEQQIQQYVTQLEQLRNMLTKIQSLGDNMSITSKTLQPLDDAQSDKLIAQACPRPGLSVRGAVTGAISGLLGNSSNQPITERQQVICEHIVLLQIDEYNITASALSELTAQQSTVQKLRDIVNLISTMGESSSATSQAEQFISQLHAASASWKKQIEADESMITALQQQQSVLSKVALNGSNSILGNIVQAGAFSVAFE